MKLNAVLRADEKYRRVDRLKIVQLSTENHIFANYDHDLVKTKGRRQSESTEHCGKFAQQSIMNSSAA